MADNVNITPGSGAVIGADDVSGVMIQRVKNTWGVDGTSTDVTAATPLPTNITDGTTIASVAALDAGFNGIVSANGCKTITFTYSATGASQLIDMANYSSMCIQLTTKATQGSFQILASNDNINYDTAMNIQNASNGTASNSTATPTLGAYYIVQRSTRYAKISVFGSVSGTNTFTIVLSPQPIVPHTSLIAVVNQPSVTISSTPAITTGTTSSVDAAAVSTLPVLNTRHHLFNGATWDRARTPALFATITATASGDTTIVTSSSGKKLRLHGYSIEISSGSAISGGGADLDIVLRDVTAAIGQGTTCFIPTLAATAAVGNCSTGWRDLGNGKLMSANQTAFNVNLSATLTSGKVRINIAYSEE